MNAAAARRLALWANGCYLLAADHTGFSDGVLTNEGDEKVMAATGVIAGDMIAMSGIPSDATETQAVALAEALSRRRPSRRKG